MTILAFFSSIFLVVTVAIGNLIYASPCDSPIAYSIGSVDPRFNVTPDQLKTDLSQATGIWSQVYGKSLFVYDPTAKFKVNLIFDSRQGLSNQINSMESTIQNQQQQIKPEIAKYQSDLANFEKKVADLNAQIKSWNDKGGAPKDQYDKLIQQQQDLKSEGDQLNARARSLNQSATDFNSQVGSLNQTINTFNSALVDKPEEGVFDPNNDRIDIYFDTNVAELLHTLAHEFGHSLGMQHVQNPAAIMYFRTNRNVTTTPDDQAQLAKVCQKVPIWKIWVQKLRDWKLQASKGA